MERSTFREIPSAFSHAEGRLLADEKRGLWRLDNRMQGPRGRCDPGSVPHADRISLESVFQAIKNLNGALSAKQRAILSMRSFQYYPPKGHGDRLALDVSHDSEHVYALFRHLEYEGGIARLAQTDVKKNIFLWLVPAVRVSRLTRAEHDVTQIEGLLDLRSLFFETACVFDKALRCRWPQILEHRRTIVALEERNAGYARVYAHDPPSIEDVVKARIAAIDGRSRFVAESLRRLVPKTQRCPYCTGPMLPGHEHLDHIAPVSRGGLSVTENLIYVCETCNIAKSDRSLFTFLTSIGADPTAIYEQLHRMGKRV